MTNLTTKERLRRAMLLCCHFSRNLAYRRVGHNRLTGGSYSELLVTVDSNFLDMAVIEWCKLFADKRGKYYYSKIVSDEVLKAQLLDGLDKSYIDEMREYRDKFLAHLDDERTMHIPSLDQAETAVGLLYIQLLREVTSIGGGAGLPNNLKTYYQKCSDEAGSTLDRCKL